MVVITLSSKISGTYEAAVKSAEKFDGKIQVVDSLNAALGERLLGLYALELAKQKLSAKEIADKLNEQKNRFYITLSGLRSETCSSRGRSRTLLPQLQPLPSSNIRQISTFCFQESNEHRDAWRRKNQGYA